MKHYAHSLPFFHLSPTRVCSLMYNSSCRYPFCRTQGERFCGPSRIIIPHGSFGLRALDSLRLHSGFAIHPRLVFVHITFDAHLQHSTTKHILMRVSVCFVDGFPWSPSHNNPSLADSPHDTGQTCCGKCDGLNKFSLYRRLDMESVYPFMVILFIRKENLNCFVSIRRDSSGALVSSTA